MSVRCAPLTSFVTAAQARVAELLAVHSATLATTVTHKARESQTHHHTAYLVGTLTLAHRPVSARSEPVPAARATAYRRV
jgi:hypothetical protein